MVMIEVSAKMRLQAGKGLSALRRSGFLPAVLYGPDVEATSLAVGLADFEKVLGQAGETSLVALKVGDGKAYDVLIHDVAKDPRTLKPIHTDFYAVRLDKPIEAKVPLAFVGESPAVESEGGILVKVVHELEVKALPKDLPHQIQVDVSLLARIEDRIHVRDVILPRGVAAKADPGEVVALIEPPRSEAELEALEKPEEAAVVGIKTEREAKAEAEEVETVEEEKPE